MVKGLVKSHWSDTLEDMSACSKGFTYCRRFSSLLNAWNAAKKHLSLKDEMGFKGWLLNGLHLLHNVSLTETNHKMRRYYSGNSSHFNEPINGEFFEPLEYDPKMVKLFQKPLKSTKKFWNKKIRKAIRNY